jgi:glutamyl-tRNA synthetase
MGLDELLPHVKDELKREGLWDHSYENSRHEWFRNTVDLIRIRYFTLKDFSNLGRPYFSDDYPMEEKAWKKNLSKDPQISGWFEVISERLESLECFTQEKTETVIREAIDEWGIKAGLLINAIRAAVTGQTVGPGLFDVLVVIGKHRVIGRLKRVAQRLKGLCEGDQR